MILCICRSWNSGSSKCDFGGSYHDKNRRPWNYGWKIRIEQESPPAWTQEAYRPPCSEYSFCCPTWVPPRGGTRSGTPPGGGTQSGTPPGGYPVRYTHPPWGGYPVRCPPRGGTRSGTPLGGVSSQVPPGGYLVRYPPRGYPVRYPPGGGYPVRYPPPPVAPWHSGKCCKALWDMGTPPPCGQTNTCENSTFPSYYVRGR